MLPPSNTGSRPSHGRVARTVARYVLVESWRSGLPWIALAGIVGVLALAAFLSRVAITESAAVQASVSAALLRAFAAFLVAAHTVAGVTRESNDKGLEHALTLPVGRPAWYLGKLLGYSAAGALLAVVFALPLFFFSSPAAAVACWALSLAAELAVIAAASLFFASALPHAVAALAAVAGLYLLARIMPAMQAIATGPLSEESATGQLARWSLEAVGMLLPRLQGVASADWLLYGAPSVALQAQALAGLGLYFLVLAAAGLFDFGRRNF